MTQLGMISVVLLFGVGFALYVGTDCANLGGNNCYGLGFIELFNGVAAGSIDAIVNVLLTAIADPLNIGLILTSGIAALLTGNRSMTLPLIALVAVANTLFMPFTFIASVPIPIEVSWLIRGFLGITMVLAVLSFTVGRDF